MQKIKLELEKKTILLYAPWKEGIAEACKSVAGAKWDKQRRCWKYPLDWQVCLDIRKNISKPMGMDIDFGPEMWNWASAEKARRQAIPDTSKQALHDLPNIRQNNPKMWEALKSRPFQTVGVQFGVMVRSYLEADKPGLGKTIQTLGVLEEAQITGPVLIVANTSAQQITWPNEIKRWTDSEFLVFDKDIPKADRDQAIQDVFDKCDADPSKRIFIIMNPYWVRYSADVDEYGNYVKDSTGKHKMVRAEMPILFRHKWAAIIADESHETLATKTNNKKKWSQQRQGLGELTKLVVDNGIRCSISGTPMRGRPENMFGQLQWLYPEVYTSFWNWAKKHFEVSDEGYKGAMEIGGLISEKRFYKELEPIMLRRDKEMVASDLPPKMYGGAPFDPNDPDSVIGVWLPMTGKQKKIYDNFVSSSSLVDDDGKKLDAIGALALYTRMKQLATMCASVKTRLVKVPELDEHGEKIKLPNGRYKVRVDPTTGEPILVDEDYLAPELPSNKFDWILEWLTERDLIGPAATGKGKVIIASQFRQVIDIWREELGVKHGTPSFAITGATTTKQRKEAQDEFQSNPDSPKIFFVQSKAGGTSLTLDQADDVILVDEMWDPDIQEQIEDRAHRLSNLTHHVTIWYLRSLDSIEQYIGTTVGERRRVTLGILDGSRGVDIRQKLIGKKAT